MPVEPNVTVVLFSIGAKILKIKMYLWDINNKISTESYESLLSAE